MPQSRFHDVFRSSAKGREVKTRRGEDEAVQPKNARVAKETSRRQNDHHLDPPAIATTAHLKREYGILPQDVLAKPAQTVCWYNQQRREYPFETTTKECHLMGV